MFVWSLSCVQLFVTPRTPALQAPMSSTISQSLLNFMSIESVMLSNHFFLCCTLLLLRSVFPSIRVFSNESALCSRWPKYWSFSFSINPSNAYSGLITLRVDWFDLLVVPGTLKSLLQHHSSKQLFRTQPSLWSNSHICTWLLEKSALTVQAFVGKVMSLLFSMLSSFVIAFLPRNKRLLISRRR